MRYDQSAAILLNSLLINCSTFGGDQRGNACLLITARKRNEAFFLLIYPLHQGPLYIPPFCVIVLGTFQFEIADRPDDCWRSSSFLDGSPPANNAFPANYNTAKEKFYRKLDYFLHSRAQQCKQIPHFPAQEYSAVHSNSCMCATKILSNFF